MEHIQVMFNEWTEYNLEFIQKVCTCISLISEHFFYASSNRLRCHYSQLKWWPCKGHNFGLRCWPFMSQFLTKMLNLQRSKFPTKMLNLQRSKFQTKMLTLQRSQFLTKMLTMLLVRYIFDEVIVKKTKTWEMWKHKNSKSLTLKWAASRQNQHNGFATSMDPDQLRIRAVWSGSMLFAYKPYNK
jgi:hypothetical protein